MPRALQIIVVAGVIVGFVGATVNETNMVVGETSIGSLLAVCAPLSSLPYTDNWEHLYVKGALSEPGQDNSGGRRGWQTLQEHLNYVYEKRSVTHNSQQISQIRPLSMKLCPPNFLLNGVKISTFGDGEFGMEHASGLVGLECVAPENNPQSFSETSVFLDAFVDQYTIDGIPFSLAQKIGLVDGGEEDGRTSRILKCDDNKRPFAHGFESILDEDGRLTQFMLLCGPDA
jgi:hypothetical protein